MYPLKRTLMAVAAVLVIMSGTSPAWALGTAANTSIINRASVTYSVSAVPQTLIESSPAGNTNPGATNGADTSFLVDDRVDLTVVLLDVANISVVPNQVGAVTSYRLTNTGNAIHDFRLVASNGGVAPFAPPADNFDMTGLLVFVEDGTTPGSYQAAEDTALFVDELAADGVVDIYILGTVPAVQVNNDVAVVTLQVVTADGGGAAVLGGDTAETVGADTAGVDVVFGDAGNDGTEEDYGGYQVATASLTITKTSAIISDPFNGAGPDRKRIPGAVIEYTVTIANAGPATATAITVSDDLTTEIGLGTISFDTGSMVVNAPNIAGSPKALTDAADADEGDFNATGANTVTVTGITLLTGENATVTYRVIITYP